MNLVKSSEPINDKGNLPFVTQPVLDSQNRIVVATNYDITFIK